MTEEGILINIAVITITITIVVFIERVMITIIGIIGRER